jgi:enoyl-CoA hydratase/carnithine racemase
MYLRIMRPSTFTLTKSTPTLWRVTFANPPINLIDPLMATELRALLNELETNTEVAVVVFDSADPDYFLAHYDIAADTTEVDQLPLGPTGMHWWLDILARLSRVPAVTVTSIRGRARGAGSEFVLATDIRFASRERAVLGQMEVGFAVVPGGGPSSRLPRLVGRGRALEILLGGDDFNGDLAERYGYVNRSMPDVDLDQFVNRFAERVSGFNRRALTEIKGFVNDVSLPADEEFPPQMAAFWMGVARPASIQAGERLFELGLQERGAVELHLGSYVGPDNQRKSA